MWERFKLITGQVWDFIAPTVKMLLTSTGKLAIATSLVAVRAAAAREELSGKEKFEFVFELVQAELASKGKTMLVRHINKIIELAYEKYASDENL